MPIKDRPVEAPSWVKFRLAWMPLLSVLARGQPFVERLALQIE